MVVAWTQLHAGLSNLFARLSGLPVTAAPPEATPTAEPTAGLTNKGVGPADGKFRFPSDVKGTRLDFKIRSVTPLGRDELRPYFDPALVIPGDTSGPGGTPALGGTVYELVGNRRYVIEVRVESQRQDVTAHAYLQAVRDRLPLPSALRELRALGLAFVESGPIIDASGYDGTGHALSVYVLELTCSGAAYAKDTPVTTIETVEVNVDVLE